MNNYYLVKELPIANRPAGLPCPKGTAYALGRVPNIPTGLTCHHIPDEVQPRPNAQSRRDGILSSIILLINILPNTGNDLFNERSAGI